MSKVVLKTVLCDVCAASSQLGHAKYRMKNVVGVHGVSIDVCQTHSKYRAKDVGEAIKLVSAANIFFNTLDLSIKLPVGVNA